MKIDPKNFQRFLRQRGWHAVDHPNKNIVYFESPKTAEGDWDSVVLPANSGLADAPERIDQALTLVADTLNVSKRLLAMSIERWDLDVLGTRIHSRRESISSIPLSLATLVVDDLRSFLGYAAYTQVSPVKFFSRAGKTASDFTSSCNFGHTFEGSFGMTIECPLSSVSQLAISEDLVDPPFERLVTLRIAEGYRQLQEAQAAQNPDILLEGYKTGMNANMLRSLIDIYENLGNGLEIEYSMNWSPELTPPKRYLDAPVFRFDGLAHELSRYAAGELEREEEEANTTIVSYVVSLRSEMPLSEGVQDEFEHIITLDWERQGGVFVRLRVALPAGEYKKACDAHKTGRKIVISGFPEKEGKFWFLTRPSEISYTT